MIKSKQITKKANINFMYIKCREFAESTQLKENRE